MVTQGEEKPFLRARYEAARRGLGAAVRNELSARVADRVRSIPEYNEAECVGGYMAIGPEVDVSGLFRGKRVFIPRFVRSQQAYEMVEICDFSRDLVAGKYGINEPVSTLPAASESELAGMFFLVPAVSCDRSGVRLGRGGGYYDRLLRRAAVKVAVIFSCQLAEDELPLERHDVMMDYIATDAELIHCGPHGPR